MLNLIEDLRFYIGLFFLIIGAILVGMGLFEPSTEDRYDLNMVTGASYIAFGALALILAVAGRKPAKR